MGLWVEPVGLRAQFYRPWCKLNLGRPKLFPIGPHTSQGRPCRGFAIKVCCYFIIIWDTFRPTKFITHYVAPQLYFSANRPNCANISLIEWLNPRGHSKFHNTWNHLRLVPIPFGLLVLPCTPQCRRFLLLPPPFFSPLPAKASTCARDRRALHQLALNVHVKHSDLTWPDLLSFFLTITCKNGTAFCFF